ncbi:hypothetical protein GCM10020000_51580 [Streptomyces olivoverticillatus]
MPKRKIGIAPRETPAFQGDGHGGVHPGQLFEGEAEGKVVAAHAAVLLGEGQAEQAHAAHFPHDLVREFVALVEVADLGGDHVVCELLDGAAEFFVFRGEAVVQRHGSGLLVGEGADGAGRAGPSQVA